jgi:hypothetical protein
METLIFAVFYCPNSSEHKTFYQEVTILRTLGLDGGVINWKDLGGEEVICATCKTKAEIV